MTRGYIDRYNSLYDVSARTLGPNADYTFYNTLPTFYNWSPVPYADANGQNNLYSDTGVFRPLNSAERGIVTNLIGMIESMISISFTLTSSATAEMGFGALNTSIYDENGDLIYGYASSLGQTGDYASGDVWLTPDVQGSFARSVLLHEIGHVLGLDHPLDAGFSGDENSQKFSIMSNIPHVDTGLYSSEFQLYDLSALHFLYGAASSFSGDSFHSNFYVSESNRQFSLWDSGGTDVIVADNQWAALIDLRPGFFSSLGEQNSISHDGISVQNGGTENVSLAFGTLIENAKGGDKDDVIIGNILSNILEGGLGKDLIYADGWSLDGQEASYDLIRQGGKETRNFEAKDQRDIVIGGGGDDSLFDGRGTDILSGDEGADFITLNASDALEDFALGGSGADVLIGGDDRVVLFGDRLSDFERPIGLIGRAASMLEQLDQAIALIENGLPEGHSDSGAVGNDVLSGSGGDDVASGGGGNDIIEGLAGNDLLLGDGGADELWGGSGDDVLVGGSGNDLLDGGVGNDELWGGSGNDRVSYETSGDGLIFAMTAFGRGPFEADASGVAISAGGIDADILRQIEHVHLTAGSDGFIVVERPSAFMGHMVIDGGAQGSGGRDSLDLTYLNEGVEFSYGRLVGTNLSFINFETIYFGSGNDEVSSSREGMILDLGAGHDILRSAGAGTEVYGGGGSDRFYINENVRVMDATAEDRFLAADSSILTGAIRWAGSAVAWAFDVSKTIQYGINNAGDLVIRDAIRGTETFVADYAANFNLSGAGIAGIYLAQIEIGAYRLLDDNKPSHMTMLGTWEALLGAVMKARFGVSMWAGIDPLVLDLDGDGLELTGASAYSPQFDYDDDGYGESGGWVGRDDGLLVLDANQDGQVTSVGELFGGPGQSGFAELATYDENADGVIDASDAIYSQLTVWRDLNQNRVVDDGEMVGLASLGIASISVAGTTSDATVNGNDVLATGSFRRTDGSTGTVGDVGFRVDQQSTTWLGNRTISAAAAALPDLKGFGTLTDLRVAMTLDPSLQAVLSATLAQLDTLDLVEMREAVLPLLNAWADASPILGNIPPGGHEDVTVLVSTVDGERVITDYAYRAYNAALGVTEWRSASTGARSSTLDGLLAGVEPEWTELPGAWLDFFERYTGEALPIGGAPTGPVAGLEGVFAGMWEQVNLMTVRLAVQGPLSEYFEGLDYDVATNSFVASTNRELIPVFEAIFSEVAAMGSGGMARLADWRPIIEIVIGDYRQEDGMLNTHGFLFSNIVAAYESTGLTLDIVDVGQTFGIPADLIHTGVGMLTGGEDADIFYLGTGNQVAVGGLGPDTYVVGRGFGSDVIDDEEGVMETHSEDVVRFADTASTEVTAIRDGLDLIITVNGTIDQLRIVDHFDGRLPGFGGGGDLSTSTGVDFIIFSDGVQWSPFDVARAVSRFTSGDDHIVGTETIDWLEGGAGNDFLSGGNDSDVYVYGRGYGHDTISDLNQHIELAGPDYLSFTDGIVASDLLFSRVGDSDDLVISIAGQEGSVTIIDQFKATYTGPFGMRWFDKLEGFLFENGSSLTWEDVLQTLLQQAKTEGDDTIYGFSHADRLDGGAGNDFLSGGNESDSYVFGRGYGHDVIHEQRDNILSGSQDEVVFKADVAVADVAFHREGQDLIITLVSGDTLRITDQYSVIETGPFGAQALDQIETFRFADGTVLNWPQLRTAIIEASQTEGDDHVIGTHIDDVLTGGAGNDRLEGGNGGDTYQFSIGDGADTINDLCANIFTNGTDTVVFGDGITADDIVVTRYGTDNLNALLTVGETGDSIAIENQFSYTTIAFKQNEVERFAFSDGTIWTATDLRNHYLAGARTNGNDQIFGFWSDDVLSGGAGNDILAGGDGSDTYVFDLGFGLDEVRESVVNVGYDDEDAITFGAGLLSTNVVFTRNGDDLTIGFAGMADQVRIVGQFETLAYFDGWRDIETITFGDGVVFTEADIRTQVLAQASTAGNDTIVGFASVADTIDGGAGNDILQGLGGGDVYLFGYGSGQDIIQESIGTVYENQPDTVKFAAGITANDVVFTRSGQDLVVSLSGATDRVTIQGHFNNHGYEAVERFEFASGQIVSQAEVALLVLANQSTPGDDIIVGTNRSDFFAGGAGNDTIRGQDGADTYYFGVGFGDDRIEESVGNVSISDFDVIVFGPGLNPADATLKRVGDDLLIDFPTGDSIRVVDQYRFISASKGWSDIEEIRFDDGTVWDYDYVRSRILDEQMTDENDVIVGYFDDNTFDGRAGNDVIYGEGGNDTYVFGYGSGHDIVQEDYSSGQGNFDTLQMKAGIGLSDLSVTRSGTNLVITLIGGNDSLTVSGFFSNDIRKEIERLSFADGTSLDSVQITALAMASQTTSGSTTITGSRWDDLMDGGTGNDSLAGGEGADTYIYRSGDGNDNINDTSSKGSDQLRLVDLNAADIELTRVSDSLKIKDLATAQIITILYQFSSLSYGGIESIEFADGVIWTRSDIAANLYTAPSSVSGHQTDQGLFDQDDAIFDGPQVWPDLVYGSSAKDGYDDGRLVSPLLDVAIDLWPLTGDVETVAGKSEYTGPLIQPDIMPAQADDFVYFEPQVWPTQPGGSGGKEWRTGTNEPQVQPQEPGSVPKLADVDGPQTWPGAASDAFIFGKLDLDSSGPQVWPGEDPAVPLVRILFDARIAGGGGGSADWSTITSGWNMDQRGAIDNFWARPERHSQGVVECTDPWG